MKNGIITDPYGNLYINSGLAPAIDSNHLYVYNCTEQPGLTSLQNTGNGINGSLNIQGILYSDYNMASRAIGDNGKSFRILNQGGIGGAWSAPTCSLTGAGSVTIEAFVVPNAYQVSTKPGTIIATYGITPGNDYLSIRTSSNDSSYTANVSISGIRLSTTTFSLANDVNPQHIMASYDATTGTLNMYVDGSLIVSATYGSANSLPTMIVNSVGNAYNSTTESFRGWITEARFSNIARSVSYAITTCETLFTI